MAGFRSSYQVSWEWACPHDGGSAPTQPLVNRAVLHSAKVPCHHSLDSSSMPCNTSCLVQPSGLQARP